jgi:hypothetical protein
MKLQFRLDKAALQEFALQHVEKIVLGVVAALFLFMAYSALQVKRFSKTPEDLKAATEQGKRNLDRPKPPDPTLVVKDYPTLVKQGRVAVKDQPYLWPMVLDLPLSPKREPRGSPALFAADELCPTAGIAMCQTTAGTSSGQRWVVLTARVPIEKQRAAYDDEFRRSSKPLDSDVPDYQGYRVQRLKINSPGEAANPNWDKAETFTSTRLLWDASQKLTLATGDCVAEAFLLPAEKRPFLAFPLPSRTGAWDKSVAHPPDIPLATTESAAAAGPGFAGAGVAGAEPMRPVGPTPHEPARGGAAPPDNEFGHPTGAGPQPGVPIGPEPGNTAQVRQPSYLLFRCFDFRVVPGETYVYRVQLVLQNPNSKVAAGYLKDPKLADAQYLFAPWSDPGPAVPVPRSTYVLAFSAKPARVGGDTSGTLTVVKWLKTKGWKAFKEYAAGRGQALNFSDVITPPGAQGGGANPGFHVDFFSRAIALDFRGGETLRRGSYSLQLVAPAEALVLGPDGSLEVHNELDDQIARENLAAQGEVAGAPAPGGPGGNIAPQPPGGLEGLFPPGEGPRGRGR